MDWYLISVIAFVLVLAGLFYRDRRNVKRESILFVRKTSVGRKFLTKLGRRFPRLWWLYGTAAVVVGFAVSAYMIVWLMLFVGESLTTAQAVSPVALVLPSPSMNIVSAPGFIGVPFWYWIISLFVLVLVHEGSHGLMAAREKVRIKSLGWGALAFLIPLAFVEPDEEQLAKQKTGKQLRVYASGSFANFLLAFVMIIVSSVVVTSLFTPSGVAFRGLLEDFPAAEANMTGTIVGVNQMQVRGIDDLSAILGEVGPHENVTVTTVTYGAAGPGYRTYNLTTAEDPIDNTSDRGFIGILQLSNDYALKEGVAYPEVVYFFTGTGPDFFGLFFFIALINLGVGAFNLLPISILDGGRMWKLALDKVMPAHSKNVMKAMGSFLLFILAFLMVMAIF